MFPCMPCLSPRGAISDLANDVKDMSIKSMKVHQRVVKHQKQKTTATTSSTRATSRGKEKEVSSGGREEEDEEVNAETEWVAEEEPGVLITLASLPLGGNRLKKIRFSEEYFDVWGAQRWWAENCDRIVSLYGVQQSKFPSTPFQSDDETRISSSLGSQVETSHRGDDNSVPSETGSAANTGEPALRSVGGGGQGQGKDEGFEVMVERPGVYVTVRSLPDGSKEMIRVVLSPEDFGGMVKARVWWEENKARLHQQYSTK